MQEPRKGWESSPLPRLSRRDQFRILGVAAVVLVAIFGLGPPLWSFAFAPAPETQSTPSPDTFRPTAEQWADLKFVRVADRQFPGLVVTDGQVATNDDTTTPVFSPYSGRVTRLIAKLGDHVEKGAPLMTVDATEAVQARNDLIAAVDALDAASAQNDVATKNEERQRELYLGQSAAQKDWQQAQSDLATARAALRTAQTALALQRNKLRILGIGDREIATLEKSHGVNTLPSEAAVLAPISGTVIQRQVGVGQYIQAGAANPVYSIGDLSALWIIGNVRESDAPLVQVGASVEATVAALPNRVFPARLTWVAPSIDANTHRLSVRAEVKNPDGVLKPMMFATVRVHTGGDRMSPAIPESAIIYEGEQARIWLAHPDKSLGLRAIQVGRDQDGEVEALAGVKPGDVVVTSGALFIDRAARSD
jgi:cobalt-zinc-cadmium efflux system membrane fusion protein